MFKPLLIASTLFGVAGLPVAVADSAPPIQFAPPQPTVTSPGSSMRQVPNWVRERRAQLGIQETAIDGSTAAAIAPPAAPQPPTYQTSGVPIPDAFAPPEQTVDKAALPAWVVEQHATMSAPSAPDAPAAPQPPAIPEWTRPDQAGASAAATQRPSMPPRPQRPQAPQPLQRPEITVSPAIAAPSAPVRTEPPARPAIPEWINERRAAMTERPVAPSAPAMAAAPAPTMTAPVMQPFARGYAPAPVYRPWGGVPHGGWGPYHGVNNGPMPWGNGWGNNWMPWGNGWGNGWGNNWMPWGNSWGGNNWGGNNWNNNYGSGWGDGWGNTAGDAAGDAAGDVDFSFAMSGRASGDMTGRGYGSGYGDGYGRGYGYNYGGPAYPLLPMPPQPMPQAPTEYVPEGPADSDRDGVVDSTDLCPETAPGTTVDALGCAETARIVLRGVNFKTDSDELTPESLSILDGVSATLSANPQIKVMVAGHTDSDGEDAYNKDLSQRRAQAVVTYLAGHGVDPANMIAKGFGEEQPIAGNDTAEGKAQNRRVELNRL